MAAWSTVTVVPRKFAVLQEVVLRARNRRVQLPEEVSDDKRPARQCYWHVGAGQGA